MGILKRRKKLKKHKKILIVTIIIFIIVVMVFAAIAMYSMFTSIAMSAVVSNLLDDVEELVEGEHEHDEGCPMGCRKVYQAASMAGTTGSLEETSTNTQMVVLTQVIAESLGVPVFTIYGLNATENSGSITRGLAYADANADIYTDLMLSVKNNNDATKYFEDGDTRKGKTKSINEAIGPFQIMANVAGSFASDIPNDLVEKAGGVVPSDITNRGVGEDPLTGTGNPLYFPDAAYGIMLKLNWALLDGAQVDKMTSGIDGFSSLDERVKDLVRVMLFEGYYHYSNTRWWNEDKKFGAFCVDIAKAYVDNPEIYNKTMQETSWTQADSNENATVLYLISLVDPEGSKGYLTEFTSSTGAARATWTLGPKAGIVGDAVFKEALGTAGGSSGGYVWNCSCDIPCPFCDCHDGEDGDQSFAPITDFGSWGTVIMDGEGRGFACPLVYPTGIHIDGRFNAWRGAHYHSGVDLNGGNGADDFGAPVVAFYSGTVTKRVIAEGGIAQIHIEHEIPDGDRTKKLISVYKHLVIDTYKNYVAVGDTVVTGQQIGQCGDSGSASSYHLHFELWSGNTRSTSFNPMHDYLRHMGINNRTGARDVLVYGHLLLGS